MQRAVEVVERDLPAGDHDAEHVAGAEIAAAGGLDPTLVVAHRPALRADCPIPGECLAGDDCKVVLRPRRRRAAPAPERPAGDRRSQPPAARPPAGVPVANGAAAGAAAPGT